MDDSFYNEEETQGTGTAEPPEVWLEATPNDQAWMEKFGRLVLFREAHGHCNVSKNFEDKELGSWVANQKSFQRAGTLRKDREKLLNEIEFTWTVPGKQESTSSVKLSWMDRYNQLVAFKEKHGHFQVTKDDTPLKNWVSAQRLVYRSGTMRQERKDLLDKIGFVWNARKGRQTTAAPKFGLTSVQNNEESWNRMFERLKRFYQQHGHTDVQANSDDLELLQWVSLQRNLHKLGHLDVKYETALREIGLTWEPQALQHNAPKNDRQMSPTREDELWMSQFRLLCEFHQQNGHTCIPRTGETSALAQWWFVQQRLLERGRLSEDKKKKLANFLRDESSMATTAINSNSTSREPQFASVNEGSTLLPIFSHAQDSSMAAASLEVGTVPFTSVPKIVEPTSGLVSSHALAASIAALSASIATVSMEADPARVHDLVASVGDSGQKIPTTSSTINTADISSEDPRVRLAHHASQTQLIANATAAGASSTAVKSSNADSETPIIIQKFAIGTRIEKVFEVDGVLQVFGGNVFSFEQFEEDDGTHTWGYMIHYDDGDKEHMLEADVEKYLVVVKKQKRATKSHQNPKSSKRAKQTSPSSREDNSAPSAETTTATILNEAVASAVRDAGTSSVTTSAGTLKDSSISRASSETNKKSGEKEAGRESRGRDAKLLRPSGEIPKEPRTTAGVKEKVSASSKPMNELDNDSSSSEDEPLHLLVRKPARSSGRKANQDVQSDGVDMEQLYLPDSPEVQTGATATNQEKDMENEVVRKDDFVRRSLNQQYQTVANDANQEKAIQHELADKDHRSRMPVSQQYHTAPENSNQEKEIQKQISGKDQQSRLPLNQQNQSVAKIANQEKEKQHELVNKDQLLHLPVNQQNQNVAKKPNEAKEMIRHEIVDLVDNDDDEEEDEESTIANSRQTSNETVNPPQRFPKGTTISRKFFDLSDNEREKSYGGKVIDFVYLALEKDWYYFIQYDDGDTEFMDEWEVAKFSALLRR
jgi:hypothetical protein